MCAILGMINNKKNISNKFELFKDMLELMSCRGKDNTGFFISDNAMLGHKRLAIMDLDNGNQPMEFENYVIVYNGELYNTDLIKSELIDLGYSFDTKCDTEVVLKGFCEFREKIMEKLEGIYAFAVLNKNNGEIFLGRDRLGVKPLYYCHKNKTFIFSSSIKSILKSEIIKPVLGKKEIGNILALGPSKALGSGVFKDIYELRPAHYMYFKRNKKYIKRYWNVVSREFNDTFLESTIKVRDLVTDAVTRQLVSDVSCATLLSGGLDSSIITAIAANKIKKLRTYSVDYEDNDIYFKKNSFQVDRDKKFIALMNKKFKTDHRYLVIDQETVSKYIEDTLYLRDYPGMIDIDSSLYWMSKEISKDNKVILSGECADEIFGGYPWFYKDNECLFPWIKNIEYRQSLLNTKINLNKIIRKEYKKTISELESKDQVDKYKKLFYINMTHFMKTLLDRKDRMTMGATVEARVPFADTKLIEYMWNVPFDYKYRYDTEKYILKKAFKDLVPKEILKRKKNPYPKTHSPEFLETVKDLLLNRISKDDCKLLKIFKFDKIMDLLDDEIDFDPWFGQLMTKPQLIAYLYQFDLWIEKYNIEIRI